MVRPTTMKRKRLSGHVVCNSAKDFLPVILSGQASYGSMGPPFASFRSWFATRGFSKATLSRSMPCRGSSSSCVSLARTEQSKPPEKSTAILVCSSRWLAAGGFGMSRTRRRRDAVNCSLSVLTDGEDNVKAEGSDGADVLNIPIPDT